MPQGSLPLFSFMCLSPQSYNIHLYPRVPLSLPELTGQSAVNWQVVLPYSTQEVPLDRLSSPNPHTRVSLLQNYDLLFKRLQLLFFCVTFTRCLVPANYLWFKMLWSPKILGRVSDFGAFWIAKMLRLELLDSQSLYKYSQIGNKCERLVWSQAI